MKVTLSNSALEDLRGIQSYYLELEVPDVGTKQLVEILNRIESLSENPDIGRVVPEFNELHIVKLFTRRIASFIYVIKNQYKLFVYGAMNDYLNYPAVMPSKVLLGAVKSCTALATIIVLVKRSGSGYGNIRALMV